MRGIVLVGLISVAGVAASQSIPASALTPALKRLRDGGYIQAGPSKKPTLEPATPESTSETGQLPDAPPGNSKEFRIIKSESSKMIGRLVFAEGGIHAQYQGYDIFAEKLSGDLRTNVFTLEGGATLVGEDAVIAGDTLTIDFNAETFVATHHRGTLRPGLLEGRTQDNVYIRGERANGRRGEIHSHDGGLTTCDLDHPHYRIDARMTTIRPEKRIIMRDTRIKIGEKTLLRIPYLSIPLDQRRDRYTPEIGNTEDLGYYIKTVWGIEVPGYNDLDAYLDYYSKLGIGYGGRFRFAGERYQGYVRGFAIEGNDDTFEFSGGHRQLFGNSMFSFESNYQRRNFFNAPENTLWSIRSSLNVPQGRSNTRINYFRNSNESATFESLQQSVGITDDRVFNKETRWSLSVNWTKAESKFASGSNMREQVDVSFRGTRDLRAATAELEYQRSIPVGDTNALFGTTDRTPVLAFKSDGRRLFGESVGNRFPITTELSVGEFTAPSRSEKITRTYFDVGLSQPDQISGRQGYSLNARFRQGVYSDDTAQFATTLNAGYRYSFSPQSAFNLRYNFLRPRGFTPLAIDRSGNVNFASADLSVKPFRTFTIGVQSGYDFRYEDNGVPTPWQQLAIRSEWNPRDWFLFRSLSSYDPILKKWSNTRLDLAYERGQTYIGVGARYDGIRKTWANLNIFADGLKYKRFSASALLAYNGYTKKFDSQQYSLIYDMHCTEAVLQVTENNFGFRPGRQIYFFIRIKAFPFDSGFGTGTRGQPIGTSTGFGF